MKLREQVLIVGTSLALIFFLSLTYIELNAFKENLEKSSWVIAEQKEKVFKEILETRLKGLESLCRDWAFWDDTYEFVDNRNEEYVASNLLFETFVNADINLMVFFDKKGEVVFAKFYDSEWNEREIPSMFFSKELLGRSGYILFNGSLLILASEQIKKSDGSGEPRGYLLMGKVLDGGEIEWIAEILGVKIDFVPFPKEEVIGKNIVTYFELRDLLMEKAFVRMEQENPFYSFYLNNLLLSLGFFGVLLFLILLYSLWWVQRGVVSKIEKFEEFMRKAKINDRIELSGSEEFENLAKGVNSMLDRIAKDEEELRFLLKVLRHDLMNAFTGIKGYLEVYRAEKDPIFLEKAEKSLERGMNIIRVVKQLEAGEMREFEIRSVLEELCKAYSIEAEIKGDAKVLADDGIYTLFGNLIENAIEHGKASKIFVEIEMRDEIIVKFSDNGYGFTKEAKEKVFKEIYSEKGSGLGLFIVKKLVEKYGGSVELYGKNTLILHFPIPKEQNVNSLR